MLKLPSVTLIMIETRQHELARMAVKECLDKVEFGDVLVFTDRPTEFYDLVSQINVHAVDDWPDKLGWSRFTWYGMAPYVMTSHALCIQWDSWVWDTSKWRDEYLNYDYIGAPWWYKDAKNVGNGGFSLRSTRLMRFLRKHRDRYPCTTALDDDLLCRQYRPRLEQEGIVWAPEKLATDFAFEVNKPDHSTFGYHAMHNWGYVLERERLIERAKIASKSDYITKNSWMWSKLNDRNPWLAKEIREADLVEGALENG